MGFFERQELVLGEAKFEEMDRARVQALLQRCGFLFLVDQAESKAPFVPPDRLHGEWWGERGGDAAFLWKRKVWQRRVTWGTRGEEGWAGTDLLLDSWRRVSIFAAAFIANLFSNHVCVMTISRYINIHQCCAVTAMTIKLSNLSVGPTLASPLHLFPVFLQHSQQVLGFNSFALAYLSF